MKRWLLTGCVVLVIAGAVAGYFWWSTHREKQVAYRTAVLERGEILQFVRASGTVQPIKLVQVGTQVTGPIRKLYVDYNDQVKEGDLVAQIDPTVYEARLAQDEANMLQCLAQVEQAEAKLNQAEKDLVRAQTLSQRDMLAKSELDAAIAGRDSLLAQLKVARATVSQAEASLRLSKANLDYTTIRSPVSGIVVARNVSEGQTVVGSMSAQMLFTVATDLREVQVEASIPEADIGKLCAGQPVTFTVDAFDQEFKGMVNQIRLASSTVQNVVTYPVIIRAKNPDLKLMPGMTANIACEVARRTDVLKIPNAALRFKPAQKTGENNNRDGKAGNGKVNNARDKVWQQREAREAPAPVPVETGISDGSFTELVSTNILDAGAEVIVGIADPNAPVKTLNNPFVPKMPASSAGRRPPH